MRHAFPLLLLILAACESEPNAPGVGGVTQSEADALNDAAEMLDELPDGSGPAEPVSNTAQ